MNVKLSRWGNSLAVRIPAQIAAEASLEEGRALEVEFSDGAIRLVPKSVAPSLEELVERISDQNVHCEEDWGDPVGGEVW